MCFLSYINNGYDFKFYFDHSSGHDCLWPNWLNANEMNKFFGGTKEMRATKINNNTYLGPHQPLLKEGDTQYMHYRPGDQGPCYLSEDEKMKQKWLCQSKEVMKNLQKQNY